MLQITNKGIEIDDLMTIRNRLVESFKKIYGEDINLDSDTPDGQLLGLFSQELFNIHQAVTFVVQMLDPYQATGRWLEQRAMYAGITRITASYSYIDEVIITGQPKTMIPYDFIVIDKNKNKWVSMEQAVLNDLGSARLKFRSQELGNLKVNALDELTASTVIIGVETITANSPSYGGCDEETDAQLLRRFMLSHSINNNDDRQGLQSALMKIIGVTKCCVYENYTARSDDKGVPAHSLNAVVLGGSDEDIAQVICNKKIGGCGLYGKIETACELEGISRKVFFDRPNKINVKVSMTLGRYKSFSDINTNEIISNLKDLDFDIGENVYSSRIISSINLVDGFYIKNLTTNGLSITQIGDREYAQITDVEIIIDE